MPLIVRAASLALLLAAPSVAVPCQSADAGQTATKEKKHTKEKKDTKDTKKKKDKKEATYPEFRFEDHPSIYFAKHTHLDFRARVQEDVRRSDAATTSAGEDATVDLAKREVGVSGEIAGAVEYQVE